jgi:hypothetical protein
MNLKKVLLELTVHDVQEILWIELDGAPLLCFYPPWAVRDLTMGAKDS